MGRIKPVKQKRHKLKSCDSLMAPAVDVFRICRNPPNPTAAVRASPVGRSRTLLLFLFVCFFVVLVRRSLKTQIYFIYRHKSSLFLF